MGDIWEIQQEMRGGMGEMWARYGRLGCGLPRVALSDRAEDDGECGVHALVVELQLEYRER